MSSATVELFVIAEKVLHSSAHCITLGFKQVSPANRDSNDLKDVVMLIG